MFPCLHLSLLLEMQLSFVPAKCDDTAWEADTLAP